MSRPPDKIGASCKKEHFKLSSTFFYPVLGYYKKLLAKYPTLEPSSFMLSLSVITRCIAFLGYNTSKGNTRYRYFSFKYQFTLCTYEVVKGIPKCSHLKKRYLHLAFPNGEVYPYLPWLFNPLYRIDTLYNRSTKQETALFVFPCNIS